MKKSEFSDTIKKEKKSCLLRPKWLTIEQEEKVQSLFESKYKRHLDNNEVWEISLNLANFIEDIFRLVRSRDEIHSVFSKIN